jgi:type III secretion protein J
MALTGCKVALYSNLTEQEANDMMAALLTAGIDTEKVAGEEGKWVLNVDEGRFAAAVERLGAAGLPRDDFASMGEVFKKEGLISSPLEERVRFIYALSQELAKTISEIDGVISARVHVVIPENNPFSDTITPSSAAVFVKHRQDSEVDAFIPQIKRLVVDSIEGLAYDKVTVVLVPSQELVGGQVAAPQMASALGLRLEAGSVGPFWAIVGALAGLALLGCGVAAWLFVRGRKAGPGASGGASGKSSGNAAGEGGNA